MQVCLLIVHIKSYQAFSNVVWVVSDINTLSVKSIRSSIVNQYTCPKTTSKVKKVDCVY